MGLQRGLRAVRKCDRLLPIKRLCPGETGTCDSQEGETTDDETRREIASRPRKDRHLNPFGSRAVCERSLALRPRLATGVPLSWCFWRSALAPCPVVRIGARGARKTPHTSAGRMCGSMGTGCGCHGRPIGGGLRGGTMGQSPVCGGLRPTKNRFKREPHPDDRSLHETSARAPNRQPALPAFRMSARERIERAREGDSVAGALEALRRRWLILAVAVVASVGVMVASHVHKAKSYAATASVAFQSGTLSDSALQVAPSGSSEPQRE